MSGYRDDRDALRERALELEEQLGDAERRLHEQQQEIERLRARRRKLLEPVVMPAVGHGKPLHPECVRYVTEGSAFGVAMAVVLLGAGVLASMLLGNAVIFLPFVPGALWAAHGRGIDVWPLEGEIVSWRWLGFRFGHERLAAGRITIAKLSVRGGWEPRANLLMNGYVLGKNLPHARARAIADEVSKLCDCPPPKSIG